MARQVIDTTTNNGTYIGDPAKTAFEKTNANFSELYTNVALKANKAGDNFTGNVSVSGEVRVTGLGGALWVQGRDTTRDWAWYALGGVFRLAMGPRSGVTTDIMFVESNGTVNATAFNPTSTSDVKDYIEGYSGDANSEIDRLVVISYRYKKSFADSDKVYIGLLQENVKSVIPDASNDSFTDTIEVDGESIERLVPGNIDMMQILALNTRAHQQKNMQIKRLSSDIESLKARLEAAGI